MADNSAALNALLVIAEANERIGYYGLDDLVASAANEGLICWDTYDGLRSIRLTSKGRDYVLSSHATAAANE